MDHAAPSVAVPLPAHSSGPVAASSPPGFSASTSGLPSPAPGSRPASPSPRPSPPATSSPSSPTYPAGPSPSATFHPPSPTHLDGPPSPATTSPAPLSPATTSLALLSPATTSPTYAYTSPPPTSSSSNVAVRVVSRPHTRSKSGISHPKERTDGTIAWLAACLSQAVADPTAEPHPYSAAMQIPHWRQAMELEYQTLIKNDTCTLVPPRTGVNVIDCKWVFKVKKHADGSIE
jgi:histone deacetylase 1/2